MISIQANRHAKEKSAFVFSAFFGVLGWGLMLLLTWGIVLLALPVIALSLWITQQFFKASIFGNAALVSSKQYPALHAMILDAAEQLGVTNLPMVFVVNGEGALNAMAVRFLSGKYVLLYASLVDLLLEKDCTQELKAILAHEIAHHAAGHTGIWKNLLIWPAGFLPFIGLAYRRACEYTADRLAALVCDPQATKRSLIAVTIGSRMLETDPEALCEQEAEIPPFFGSLNEIYSTHPRLSLRLRALDQVPQALPVFA